MTAEQQEEGNTLPAAEPDRDAGPAVVAGASRSTPETPDATARQQVVQSAAKWLTGALGAIAAVVVAGVQLRALGDVWLAHGVADAVIVVACIVLMLGAVGGLLWLAARVLVSPRISVRDLAERELAAGVLPGQPRVHPANDRRVQQILDRASDLLDPFDTSNALYQAHQREADPNSRLNLRTQIARVEAIAGCGEVDSRFGAMLKGLWILGPLFVLALIGYIVFTTPRAGDSLIDAPRPVTIFVPKGNNFFGSACPTKLTGVAIGGTYNSPLVALPAQSGCPAQTRQLDGHAMTVVPAPH